MGILSHSLAGHVLPSAKFQLNTYSKKVFIGGLPPDISTGGYTKRRVGSIKLRGYWQCGVLMTGLEREHIAGLLHALVSV